MDLDLDTLTLAAGAHDPGDAMCVMEAVAFIAGEPWSDHPTCASNVIGTFMRSLNDTWDDEQRQTLKPFIPRLVGTQRGDDVESELSWMATDWLVRTYTPAWLRLAGLDSQADLLAGMVPLDAGSTPALLPALKAVRQDADAAGDAAWAAARDAAGDAAGAAARAAARAAAADAAGDAAGAAAWAAAGAAAGAAAWAAAWAAAGAAARDAIAPTVTTLQASALDLIDRMINHAKAVA